jgi:hypothetical protein
LLVALHLSGEFGDWRDQLTNRRKESERIGGIEGDPEVGADGLPPRRDGSKMLRRTAGGSPSKMRFWRKNACSCAW